jgi:tryptophanyl-tRNA synthetase
MAARKRILTGLQPSGALHIGNYLSSLRPLVALAKDPTAEVFLMVADYHALTSVRDASLLRRNIYDIVKDYLAVGIDPVKMTLFRQSDNPDHTELGWVLNCLVTVPFLMQAHAYKDKVQRGLEANAGLFTYPMLMAADILLYETDLVPVGEDQRQHLEYAREAAAKFNHAYGHVLKEPKEMILEGVGVVPGTDGQKMSKSYQNTISLFSTKDELREAVMSIVTDSAAGRPKNVYAIHKALRQALGRSESELEAFYNENEGRYRVLKETLAAELEALLAPLRARRAGITDEEVRTILAAGAARAQAHSGVTLARVREAIGISLQ